MSNSFNISVAPEIAALSTLVTTVDTVVDLIRGTDVPNIQTNINANETKIDTIDGIVDAIKLKTDTIPQNVRGTLTCVNDTTVLNTWVEILNISGQGILAHIAVNITDASNTISCVLTIDGVVSNTFSHTGDTVTQMLLLSHSYSTSAALFLSKYDKSLNMNFFNHIHFDTSLVFKIALTLTDTGSANATISYLLDNF